MSEITKVIFTGLEGAGKSYEMAYTADWVLSRNIRKLKKGYPMRRIATNMNFSQEFLDRAKKGGIEVVPFVNLSELIKFKECDIFIDEIAVYFDSARWELLSDDVRRWLSMGNKKGIVIYGTTQDFGLIATAFRRKTSRVFYIRKLMGSKRPSETLGSPWFVWGVIAIWRVDPRSFDGDDSSMETIGYVPFIKFIKKRYTRIFDTSQEILKSDFAPLEHISRVCETCGKELVTHR